MKEFDSAKIEAAIKMILEAVGEDPNREGLLDTPKRVAKMYQEVFQGLGQNPREHLGTFFSEEEHEELVLVKDILFHSMCEHHLVPFFGKAHVAYIPQQGKIAGLSKLARVVDTVTQRPQLQERITKTIANIMMEELEPLGVMVMVEAEHMCMSMRGIKKPGTLTVTSAVRGIFAKNANTRQEVLDLINK